MRWSCLSVPDASFVDKNSQRIDPRQAINYLHHARYAITVVHSRRLVRVVSTHRDLCLRPHTVPLIPCLSCQYDYPTYCDLPYLQQYLLPVVYALDVHLHTLDNAHILAHTTHPHHEQSDFAFYASDRVP